MISRKGIIFYMSSLMNASFLGFNLFDILIGVPVTLIALSMHEFAHGWVSYKLGDPTPKYQGRLTLNPAAHLDLVGTLMMIFFKFGWAKPVQINPAYYKDRTKGMALTAAAGPIMNFLLAFAGIIIGALISQLLLASGHYNGGQLAMYITQIFVVRNLCFMVFNLIPFPPLDGFKVAGMIFPKKFYYTVLQYEQYIMWILMILCFIGAFDLVIGTAVGYIYRLLAKIAVSIISLFV